MQSIPNFIQFDANIDVLCPYCGHKSIIPIRNKDSLKLVYCDRDDGGCGNEFAIKSIVKAEVTVKRFELKLCDDNEKAKQN